MIVFKFPFFFGDMRNHSNVSTMWRW